MKKCFFANINFLFLLITTAKKIIVVTIFVNFLRIFKVYNFAHFHVLDRGIAENGASWLLTSFREQQGFVSEKNICEHAIVCQNRCRMQGICVAGDCSNTGYTG